MLQRARRTDGEIVTESSEDEDGPQRKKRSEGQGSGDEEQGKSSKKEKKKLVFANLFRLSSLKLYQYFTNSNCLKKLKCIKYYIVSLYISLCLVNKFLEIKLSFQYSKQIACVCC